MTFITSLTLGNFRNYRQAELRDLPDGPVVLYGENGAGKTNILEALSLLSPGRGLRGARMQDLRLAESASQQQGQQQQGGQQHGIPADGPAGWSVAARIETPYGEARIGTGTEGTEDKRLVRINGIPAKGGQAAMAEYVSVIWMTPQMDRIFIDSAGGRRRFLDRLVYAFDPAHAGRVTRYENTAAQRAKLLKEHQVPDPNWLAGLEVVMAETGIAIAAARLDFVQRLQKACDTAPATQESFFPNARLALQGTIEELLLNAPALEVEEMFKYQLKQTRRQDAVTGRAASGPHKSDLRVDYAAKDTAASLCSTGEQKALLMSIILAHGRLLRAERSDPPVILLDEVAAHFDAARRAALYDQILSMGGQFWLTGTDRNLFTDIEKHAVSYRISGAVPERIA